MTLPESEDDDIYLYDCYCDMCVYHPYDEEEEEDEDE